MNLKQHSAWAALAGVLTGRLLQNLPPLERAVWSRCIVAALLTWALVALLVSGCTITADGHKVSVEPLSGWAWSYTGATAGTNSVTR